MTTETGDKILFESQLLTTRAAREKFLADIPALAEKMNLMPALDRYEFRLVLDEAITNAMEHGNLWDPTKLVLVTIRGAQGRELLVTIKDQGFGFNTANVPEELNRENKTSHRGRGIYIMRKFCRVSWNSIGNEITLGIPLKKD